MPRPRRSWGSCGTVRGGTRLHVDHAVLNEDPVRAHRCLGGRAGHLPGTQVEARGVQGALNGAAVQPAVGQRGVLVRARVVDRVEVTVDVEDRNGLVSLYSGGLAGRQRSRGTDRDHEGSRFVRVAYVTTLR